MLTVESMDVKDMWQYTQVILYHTRGRKNFRGNMGQFKSICHYEVLFSDTITKNVEGIDFEFEVYPQIDDNP